MSSLLTAEVSKVLKPVTGLTVIITVGNTLRCDDGVGPYIAAQLESNKSLVVIDAASNPENFIDEISALKPQRIIIIDAADFGGTLGEIRAVDRENIPESSISTHLISLGVIASILKEDCGAEIKFLGIQPKDVNFGEGLHEEVREAADLIVAKIKKEFCHA